MITVCEGVMKKSMRSVSLILLALSTVACGGGSGGGSPTGPSTEPTYDILARGIPQFVSQQYVPLTNIDRISRFRSSEGHSYNAGGNIPGEPCRSMKHYFSFLSSGLAPATQLISSPVDGTIRALSDDGGFGFQVNIKPTAQPAFWIILFHVTPSIPLAMGTTVSAGQRLGAFGGGPESDVAVGVQTPQGFRLVSWFEVITEALFQEYRAKGVVARDDMIISQAARDADPLACNGESFTTRGTLPRWVALGGFRCPEPGLCLGQ